MGDEDRATLSPLLDLKIRGPGGKLVPVSAFTRIETDTAPRALHRFQQRNAMRIFSGVIVLLGSVPLAISGALLFTSPAPRRATASALCWSPVWCWTSCSWYRCSTR